MSHYDENLIEEILIKNGFIVSRLSVVGCNSYEIESIKRDFQLDFLPPDYILFLRHIGKTPMSLFRGSDFTYPHCIGNLGSLKDSTKLYNISLSSFRLLLPFFSHQGYVHNFLDFSDENEYIYGFVEGEDGLTRVGDGFFNWLVQTLNEHSLNMKEIQNY